jgi:tetratricopeptide (TPR) repeat protein
MRAAYFRAFALSICLVCTPAFALDPPDHERWEASMKSAEAAIRTRNVATLKPALEGIFEQAIRMRDQDPRVPQSGAIIGQALQVLEVDSRAGLVAALERLDVMTRVPGGLASAVSATPAMSLAGLLMQDRKFVEARELMRGVAERATADLGAAHNTVRLARQQEARAAVAAGDFEGALASLGEALESARRTFGPTSNEYADILIATARVREQRNDVSGALELADEALALVTGRASPVLVILQLAGVYEDCGELAKARDLYQRGDVSNAEVQGPNIPVLIRLAYVNARLGDGAAARTFTARASDIGRSVAQRFPGFYLDALFNEAAIYSMAGEYDQAVASIERAASLPTSLSPEQVRALDRRIASAYLGAQRWDRALAIGSELLRAAPPETADYAAAAAIVVLAAAQHEPPSPRAELAQQAIDIRRKLDPQHEPHYELFALAMSHAAAGRLQESAVLQRQIMDSEIELRGNYEVSWQQLRTYAATLERLGRSAEAAEVSARVRAESAPLAAALGAGAVAPVGVFVSEQSAFGFGVQLDDARWRRRSGEVTGWPLAAFSALFYPTPDSNEATLAVIPVLLPEGLDRDVALAGFLSYLNEDRGLLRPWSAGNQTGYEYRFSHSRVPGRPYNHTGRVLLTESGFYLAVAAVAADSAAADTAAAHALDQVVVRDRPDTRALGPADRKLHSNILNNVGVGIAGQARFSEALVALETAREFDVNETLLQNIILVNLNAGNYAAVRDEVGRYPGGAAAYPQLYFARALSERGLGNATAAIADFRAGFAAGVRDDNSASEYVELLLAEDQDDAAATFLDEYAREKSSPEIISLQALLGVRLGDKARLERALSALEDPLQSNAEAALVAALIHLQSGGYREVGAFIERLPAELVSAELYGLLAAAQIEAELFNEARRTVARGLEISPTNPELKSLEESLRGTLGSERVL